MAKEIPKAERLLAIFDSEGRIYGPCGKCAFFRNEETPAQHETGRCHGAPPMSASGWPVVHRDYVGCAVFRPAP